MEKIPLRHAIGRPPQARQKWEATGTGRMPGGSRTCTAMSQNGAWTGMACIALGQMWIRSEMLLAHPAYAAAEDAILICLAVVPQPVIRRKRREPVTVSAFALRVRNTILSWEAFERPETISACFVRRSQCDDLSDSAFYTRPYLSKALQNSHLRWLCGTWAVVLQLPINGHLAGCETVAKDSPARKHFHCNSKSIKKHQ